MSHLIRTLTLLAAVTVATPVIAQSGDAERGAYMLAAAGCVACHTVPKDGAFLAGGRELKTDFGSFYTPNITPDPETGIGNWSDEDFIRAMKKGVSPDGGRYYPTFPYTSYTRMTRQDMLDLKAYLDTVPPVRNAVPDHDLAFPFGIRASMMGWQLLFFDDTPFEADTTKSDAWNRGAYLVNGPGHCGECHTPRNLLGVVDSGRPLAGNANGPEGDAVPNITPHSSGIGGWSEDDIVSMLEVGLLPDGDFAGGAMTDVIEESTSKLSEDDRKAIASYLLSLPPLADAQ
ncbi:MAG: c-type cytochrome [Alphaproteobacteria bacterium]